MNFVTVCAQLREDPREAFTGATNTVMRCKITLPPYGKKAPTDLELTNKKTDDSSGEKTDLVANIV